MIVVNSRFLTKKITGLERFASEITPLLKRLEPEIIFVTHKGIIHEELASELGAIEFGKLKEHLWEQIELPAFLRKNDNPPLLNPVNTGPLYYKNQITVIHDIAFIINPEWYSKKAAIVFKFIVSRVAGNSKKIITVSEFTKNEIIKYLNVEEDKIKVVHASVPQRIIDLSEKDYMNKYGDYILTVGTLEPRKNIPLLIKAYNDLKRGDIKLVIAGAINNKVFASTGLSNFNNPNIIFTGYVDDPDLVGLYKNARVLVYPSLYEGFGYPPLEALACCCPVLVSNSSCLPEICGNTADYFDPLNTGSLSELLNEMLKKSKGIKDKKLPPHLPGWGSAAREILSLIK